MKKLINFSGGRGYYVDDVRVLQEQLESLKLVFKAFGDRMFIIYGCEVTPGAQAGQINVSPGLVYLNGMLVEVTGVTNFATDLAGFAYIYDTLDTGYAGAPFESRYYDLEDTFKEAFSFTIAHIVATEPGPTANRIPLSLNPIYRTTWIDYLKLLLTNEETKVEFLDWASAGVGNLLYRKDFQGYVRFKGAMYRRSGNGQAVFNLPDGFRPSSLIGFTVNGSVDGSLGFQTAKSFLVQVFTNGNLGVYLVPDSIPTGLELNSQNFYCPLDSIFYLPA